MRKSIYFKLVTQSVCIKGFNRPCNNITCNIYHMYGSVSESLQQAAFQVGSIITTTGYATTDFNLWPEISRTILVMLMFIGACAGSTGGGIKVSRILILCKTIRKELHIFLHPNAVKK